MQLCFDATRFGLGLVEAVEFAAAKGIGAVEFTFEPFESTAKTAKLAAPEKEYLKDVAQRAKIHGIEVACIRLDTLIDSDDKSELKRFQQMMLKLALVAKAVDCTRLSFSLKPGSRDGWVIDAAAAILPVLEKLEKDGIKLLLSLSTPAVNRGRTLRQWRPMEPQEWRDLIANCPGLSLSFSAADCAWQSIDYLQILPGIVAAVEHVEANDIEINRALLVDSGLFGPLWWRYRRPGKGQIDWRQLIEALKLYDYKGTLSIHLDDEFIDGNNGNLEESLDESIKFLMPLVKY
jgi:sugar phosphate isomerase/epimerase